MFDLASGLIGGAMSLFGGGSQDQAEIKPWDPASPYMKDIMGEAQGLYGYGSMNPLQMLGLQNQLGYWEQTAPLGIGGAQESWYGMLNPWGQAPMSEAWDLASGMAGGAENPYAQTLMDMTRDQMVRGFEEGTLPAIQQDAMATGGLGGSRQGIAEGLATERFNQDLADQQNALAAEFYAQNLGREATGLGYLSNLLGTGYGVQGGAIGQAGEMIGLGAYPGLMQTQIGDIYQGAPWQNLENYSGIVNPYTGLSQVAQGPNIWSQMGGQLIGGALPGLIGSLF